MRNVAYLENGALVDVTTVNSLPTMVPLYTVSVEITRPTNTDTYDVGDIINVSTATVLPTMDFSVAAGLASGTLAKRNVLIIGASVLSNNGGAAVIPLTSRAHLFNAAASAGLTLTDNAPFVPSYAVMKANLSKTIENISAVVHNATGASKITQNDIGRKVTLPASGCLYPALVTTNGYIPISGETLTLSIDFYLLN